MGIEPVRSIFHPSHWWELYGIQSLCFNSFWKTSSKGYVECGLCGTDTYMALGEKVFINQSGKSQLVLHSTNFQDAREKIELQVNQAAFKVKKKLVRNWYVF